MLHCVLWGWLASFPGGLLLVVECMSVAVYMLLAPHIGFTACLAFGRLALSSGGLPSVVECASLATPFCIASPGLYWCMAIVSLINVT